RVLLGRGARRAADQVRRRRGAGALGRAAGLSGENVGWAKGACAASPRTLASPRLLPTRAFERVGKIAKARHQITPPVTRFCPPYRFRDRSLRGPAAVEEERGAGHQRGGIGREKDDRAGQLVELAEAAELDLAQDLVAERLVLEERPRHRRL